MILDYLLIVTTVLLAVFVVYAVIRLAKEVIETLKDEIQEYKIFSENESENNGVLEKGETDEN